LGIIDSELPQELLTSRARVPDLLRHPRVKELLGRGNSPLHVACQRGDLSAVKQLCEFNHIDVINECEDTPLNLAFRGDHKEICEYLISQIVHDVSGGIVHTTPDNKYVRRALELFCLHYNELNQDTKSEIKYVLVGHNMSSLICTSPRYNFVWEAASNSQTPAQVISNIPQISLILNYYTNGESDIFCITAALVRKNIIKVWHEVITVEENILRRIERVRHITAYEARSLYNQFYNKAEVFKYIEYLDWKKNDMWKTEALELCAPYFCCENVSSVISDLSAHSSFPFHFLLSQYGILLYYFNIESLNMSKWSDYYDIRNEDGDLPLHIICRQLDPRNEKFNTLLRIFSEQCDLDTKNDKGQTPLNKPYYEYDRKTQKYLVVNKQRDVYQYGTENQCYNADYFLKLVFEDTHITFPSSITVDIVPGDTLLHVLAKIPGLEDGIEFLVQVWDITTFKMNSRNEFPLHTACRTGHSVKSLQVLAGNASQKDVEGKTPFDILVENHPSRYDLMVCVMKSATFSTDTSNSSLEMLATQHFCDSEISYFESWCSNSYNVLHIALELNKISLVQIIKENFPSKFQEFVSLSNILRELPFHLAGRIRNKEALSLVYDSNTKDPNVGTHSGNTALHEACIHSIGSDKDIEAVKYLIQEIRCDPLHSNKKGNTALHLACRKGCINIVNFLLKEVKVNPNIRNKEGCTPLMLTSLYNH